MEDVEALDAVFAALANPTRRAILSRLAEGEATVNTLAEPFKMSLPAISKHLRVLEQAELITRGKDAQFRPCRLNAERLKDVVHWTEQYRHIWDARFDALDRAIEDFKGDHE
ncbi:DNA-binding transcriptional ArsR family regulator [Devosia subaequoris]|uniref:DNA-binding transcriptional ArsR family regulator n=1 Tax=Devosia subaequoris TaxID=395930 RepID=A0A7W6NC44_9HYPH|nr:metalloregulator ArsR/SmtB family transcription factor [Devosia subaequoris]MBB4053229.1 DNA-binding transcriptional ArsR family regulator [Devosia subaequoris]MCP1210640.1 metalloregulator ArsR/SmtB family transcription factor [Devosia subaequoris]